MVDLRKYQHEQHAAIARAFFVNGYNRVLVQAATGTGKTTMFSSLPLSEQFAAWLSQFPETDRRMLAIAHREELLDQAANRINEIAPQMMATIEQGDRHANKFSPAVVASIQTLTSTDDGRRLRRLIQPRSFRIVVVDEAHHAAAQSYRDVLARLGFLPANHDSTHPDFGRVGEMDTAQLQASLEGWDRVAPKDRFLLGVTATPVRTDGVGLACVFQTIAHTYPIRKAIEDGWLTDIEPWVVETRTSLDDVKVSGDDFNQKQLADAVNTPERNRQVVEAWERYAKDRPFIAFTVDVKHAHDLAECFNQHGVKCAPISGKTDRDVRRDLLRRYGKGGHLMGLANCMVLTEGTDLPITQCIIHAKPTKSASLYEQMTGRGLRLYPGKDRCVLIDIVDATTRHSLQTAPVLYGLPPGINTDGKKLDDLADELQRLIDETPGFDLEKLTHGGRKRLTMAEIRTEARTFNIWAIPSMGIYGKDRALVWIRSGECSFHVIYPWGDDTETVTVQPDMVGNFDVSCTIRARGSSKARQRTLVTGISTAEDALQVAEHYVIHQRGQAMKLVDNSAAWRKRPVSAGQHKMLKRYGIPYRAGMTSGEASTLIDIAINRRGGRR